MCVLIRGQTAINKRLLIEIGLLAGTLVYRQDPDPVGQNMGPGLLGFLTA